MSSCPSSKQQGNTTTMENKLAKINDEFRHKVLKGGTDNGRSVITQGIGDLDGLSFVNIINEVANYTNFDEGEENHDFGMIELENTPRVFWKIDDFEDKTMMWGAENPETAYKVLTIMLAEEW